MDLPSLWAGIGRRFSRQEGPVNHCSLVVAAVGSALFLAGPAVAAKPPASWEGLVQVKCKQLGLVYLQPGADFRAYSKVLIEPTEVAFQKDWQRDYNRSTRMLGSKVSDSDLQEAVAKGVAAATD